MTRTFIVATTIIAICLRIAFLGVSVQNLEPSTDEAIGFLQAQSISHGSFPLLYLAQPYLFPIESYLTAPFIPLLPATAIGVRLIPFFLGLLGTFLGLYLMRHLFPRNWIPSLLILFPSAYLLLFQCGHTLPHYGTATILCLSALALLVVFPRSSLALVTAGFASGLAFSAIMIFLPFILALLLVAIGNSNKRPSIRHFALFSFGLLLGLTPLLLGKWLIPGAHSGVSSHYDLLTASQRLFSSDLNHAVISALGFTPPFFPDEASWTPAAIIPLLATILWPTILLLNLFIALKNFRRRVADPRAPLFTPHDALILVAITTIAIFAYMKRADSNSYRYLLSFVLVWPFLLTWPFANRFRRIGNFLIIVVACFNLLITASIVVQWTAPEFAARSNIPSLRQVIAWLQEKNIRHAVASSGVAYRLTMLATGSVTCAQPFNERFPGWPVPYKEEVDAATNVAYVLTDHVRFLKPSRFEQQLASVGVTAATTNIGHFSLYYDFRPPPFYPDNKEALPPAQFSASHNKAVQIPTKPWSTVGFLQQTGMWLQAEYPSQVTISTIVLDYGQRPHDCPPGLSLEVWQGDHWQTAARSISPDISPFVFRDGHPVYGQAQQIIKLPATSGSLWRFIISEANPRFAWSLAAAYFYPPPAFTNR